MGLSGKETQDRRSNSRVIARMDCTIACGDGIYEGVIVDLSIKGALVSSKFPAPAGSEISITLRTPLLKEPLSLTGNVLRTSRIMSEHEPMNRIAVRFGRTPLDLVVLVNKLVAR